ncbi:Uncharacterized protein QJS10_CPA05g01352 [Acorus calamus]|uniref:MORF/ORRM1/DAG-like MORF domain-containing protein n=1 Tax=Acorus calamus TaxID=4465 RepID=A0AAV9EV65_ACOCL|nr:Uncharacterized protein QJS10_CPA05g01352 [Acorus calamus]
MATLCRTLISSRSLLRLPLSRLSTPSSFPLFRLRPLVTVALRFPPQPSVGLRCFSTRTTTSSLNDPSPNFRNRPPKETILLDGCDFEHWLVVMEPPDENVTRDEIIDSYIKTLAQVVGSEQDARMKIYSVSTKHYFAFGALVSEELSYKIKELPRVRWVLPDSYLDVKNKDYGGEPFIDGVAAPYDPKYHEEWVRNNARANERSRRNDRPRNFDRSRNFERRRENMQNQNQYNRDGPPPMQNQNQYNRDGPPPMQNQSFQNRPNVGGPPPPPPGQGFQNQPNMGGPPPPNRGYQGPPPPNPGYQGPPPPNPGYQGPPPNPGYQGYQNHPNQGGVPPPRGDYGGMPPNRDYQNSNYGPPPNRDVGGMAGDNAYQPRDTQGRDLPPLPNRDY